MPKSKKLSKLQPRYRIYCYAPLIVTYKSTDKNKKKLKRVLLESDQGFITGVQKTKLFEYPINAVRPSKKGKNWLDVRLPGGSVLTVNKEYFVVEKLDKKK